VDVVLLSGCALLGTVLAAMAGLIRAEVRYTRRAVHYRAPHQPTPFPRGHARPAGARHDHGGYGIYTYARRPRDRADNAGQRSAQPAQPAPAPPVNPWAPFVLGPDTRCDDLKRQYRALARAHHPDHGGDPRVMARINLLYAALVNSR